MVKLWECDWPAEMYQHFLTCLVTWFNACTSGQCWAGMLPDLAMAEGGFSALGPMCTFSVANTQLPCVGWCVCACTSCVVTKCKCLCLKGPWEREGRGMYSELWCLEQFSPPAACPWPWAGTGEERSAGWAVIFLEPLVLMVVD